MTSRFPDDTELDAIASQMRSLPRLADGELGSLLDEAQQSPAGPATARLIEQQLGLVLDAVLARRGQGVDLMDLYQEGSVAATVAVEEYATRGGASTGLRAYVIRVVDSLLDEVIEREATQRLADAMHIEQVKLLEGAELALRGRLERQPTTLELAAALDWTPETVDIVGAALRQARDAYDAEIVPFLDDADEGGTTDI